LHWTQARALWPGGPRGATGKGREEAVLVLLLAVVLFAFAAAAFEVGDEALLLTRRGGVETARALMLSAIVAEEARANPVVALL